MQTALFDLDIWQTGHRSWFQDMTAALGLETSPGWPDRFGWACREWLMKNNHRPIKALSLFSGGGGLDIGFHDAGFDVLQMIEIESSYAETLKANAAPGRIFERAEVLCMDIRDYTPSRQLEIDFIIGGPPCQTFSAAGRRAAGVAGTTDPRGVLFEEYVRILRLLRPKGFLFENVYGITGAQDGAAWRDIQAAFKGAGYSIYHRVLDAADYGVPQHRERLFIVGLLEGSYLFPEPTHGPDAPDNQPYYTAGQAVIGADTRGMGEGLRGRYGHLLADIPPGLNYSFYTREMGHPSPVFSWRSKFSDFLYKADPTAPVRTIKAQGGQYTGPFSWENRPFSIAELKRLQTIPDAYQLVGSRGTCIAQVGNSVPPQLARLLALSILNQVLHVPLPFNMRYLPENKTLGFRRRKRLLTQVYAERARDAIQTLFPVGSAIAPPDHNRHNGLAPSTRKRYLSPTDFRWAESSANGGVELLIRCDDTSPIWVIAASLSESCETTTRYEITVSPAHGRQWNLAASSVKLQAADWNYHVFTGLWKAFEELVLVNQHIADLVQLSGYYQYSPRVSARLDFVVEPSADSSWSIIRKVVEGSGVAAQLNASQLSMVWESPHQEVLGHLKRLRQLGYEVRSHSTNPQIRDGDYLIPYIFPTLTPRSVQLRKRLEPKSERATSEGVR